MHNFKKLLGAAAAIPLAIALAYPAVVTAQAQQRTAQPDSSGPTRKPTATPTQPTVPGVNPQQRGSDGASPFQAMPNSRPPQAAGNYASPLPTGVCSQGFAKVAEALGMQGGKQVYSQYTCEGDAPKCPVEKAAAEKGPSLQSVNRQNPGGAEGSGPFTIGVNYKVNYEYGCSTPPLKCLDKAQNGHANYVEVEVKRSFVGDRVNYRCRYVWNQG